MTVADLEPNCMKSRAGKAKWAVGTGVTHGGGKGGVSEIRLLEQNYLNRHNNSPYFFGLWLGLRGLKLLRLQSKSSLILRG